MWNFTCPKFANEKLIILKKETKHDTLIFTMELLALANHVVRFQSLKGAENALEGRL